MAILIFVLEYKEYTDERGSFNTQITLPPPLNTSMHITEFN